MKDVWGRLGRVGWVGIGIAGLAIVLRLALPSILQRVAISQGEEYLHGTLEIGDVDLWLLAGGVAVENASLRRSDAPPDDPPLVAWERAYVDIGWLALLTRTIRIEDFELDGLSVNVARLQDGSLLLPSLRERPEEPDEDEDPFAIQVDRAALTGGRLRVRDDVPATPTHRELELPSVVVTGLTLDAGPESTPGQIVVEAALGGGTIRLDTTLSESDGGLHTQTEIDIEQLPLDQLHVHVPGLGWSHSTGRLDTALDVTVDREARILATGKASLSDLRIDVPHENDPALAWRRLSVDIDTADIATRQVSLARVALDGAQILVRPQASNPLPILAGEKPENGDDATGPDRKATAPDDDATGPDRKATAPDDDANGPDRKATAPDDDATGPDRKAVDGTGRTAPTDAPSGSNEGPEPPWTIRIAEIELTDADADAPLPQGPARGHIGTVRVSTVEATPPAWSVGRVDILDSSAGIELRGGPALLEIATLGVTGLSSDPGSALHVVGEVRESSAKVEIDSNVTLEPLAVAGKLDIAALALGRYADLTGVSPVRLPTGTLDAALDLDYTRDLARVAGTVAVTDLDIVTIDGRSDFAVSWDQLDLDIRSAQARLSENPASVKAELASVKLVGPKIRATRTADGIVLPAPPAEKPFSSELGNASQKTPAATSITPVAQDAPAGAATDTAAHDTPADTAAHDTPADTAAHDTPADTATDTAAHDAPTGTATDTAAHDAPAGAAEPRSVEVAAPPPETSSSPTGQPITKAFKVTEVRAAVQEVTGDIPIRVRIDDLSIEKGRLRLVDRVVDPVYRAKVDDLEMRATGFEFPARTFRTASIELEAPGGAPVSVVAEARSDGIAIDTRVRKLPLAQFSGYVRQAAGYTVLDGSCSVESEALWGGDRYSAETDLTFYDLDVGSESGGTLFFDTFGISIEAALALMRDVTGKIGLGIPVRGSVSKGTEVGVVPIVTEALAKAILNAITSPLKLLGAVTTMGNKLGELDPTPIAFRPGTTEVRGDARGQIAKIAGVLEAAPQVRLELIGRAGPDDVRALKEAAVLADLREEGGFVGGLRNLTSGGSRSAVQRALEARENGADGELDADDVAVLEELVAEKTVSDEELDALARARVATLRRELDREEGVADDQLTEGDPDISVEVGAPEVGIEIVSRRS